MRDAETKSFRARFQRLCKPSTAEPAAQPPPAVAAPAVAAPAVAAPAVAAPAVAAFALALAPEPAPEALAIYEPQAATDEIKLAGSSVAGWATRVLVIASDRRFRAVAATLLTQRGYAVAVGGRGEDIAELAVRERADVVIIDASASLTVAAREAARLGSLRPRVGVVAVSDGSGHGLAALPVLPKWSSFDEVFRAIDRARADSARGGATYVTP